jgi:hypothetical protein
MNARGHYGSASRRAALGRGRYSDRYVGADPTPFEPRYAARRRAVKAIFYFHDRVRAPLYVYAEVDGVPDASPAGSLGEAHSRFSALRQSPAAVYAAIFDVNDAAWPDPALETYHAASSDTSTAVGDLVRLPGEIEDELKRINTEVLAFGQEIIDQTAGDTKEAVLARLKADGIDTDAKAKAKANARSLDELADTIAKNTPKRDMPPAQVAFMATWSPFSSNWRSFYGTHIDIPLQNLPGSGAWEHSQQFLDDLRNLRAEAKKAGFKVTSPEPHATHHDDFDLGKIAKYAALGVGGLILSMFVIRAVTK